MKKNRLIFRTIILLVLVGAVGYTLYQNFYTKKEETFTMGEVAPNFVLKDLNEKEISLEDYKGKGVVLNFWGSWCPPCKEEMPALNNLHKKYKDKGVEVLGVNAGDTPLVAQTFAEKMDLEFPSVMDTKGDVQRAYKVVPLPTTFLIDSDGKVVRMITGIKTEAEFEEYFKEIMPS
ncbi:thiol-disulfide oxidoreductase ResA [Priestia taiwanensis]|uniref:Thiol-disulfide oxidoreductase ResA n=1 Tax=Priestia taiwanensis TaxID=1347902 RepID=A0A917AK50_9BACI|nr:thiol-disulfide oxidoreductase ResA [Priestia taiwanensis]MBM7361562.1 peroxiredoxin [Priestia taiwanensis]GGE55189.1 thiol-disulfide oxidoreductase ResA [Priestia taiwanensis]